jgi:hypothetical protein
VVDNKVKFVLPKVWIQFMRLPSHLRDFSDHMDGWVNHGSHQGCGYGVHKAAWDKLVAGDGDEP